MRRTRRNLRRRRPVVKVKKDKEKKVAVKPIFKDHKPKPYKKRQRWDAILDRLPRGEFLKGCEVGVLNGNTSHRILYARPLLTLIMIDPWDVPPPDSSYAKEADTNALKPRSSHIAAYEKTRKLCAFARERAIIHRAYSRDIARITPEHSLDFVFIDGDHSYEGVIKDIHLWYSKIKPGGFISGHDIFHPKLPGVEKAVYEFFEKDSVELDDNRTWFVRL